MKMNWKCSQFTKVIFGKIINKFYILRGWLATFPDRMQHKELVKEVKKIIGLNLYKEMFSNETFRNGKGDFFNKLNLLIECYLNEQNYDNFWALKDLFNELLAIYILTKKLSNIESISYETHPTYVDFQIVQDDKLIQIEVKTIRPDFDRAKNKTKYYNALKNYFPPNHCVIFKDQNGGNRIEHGIENSRLTMLGNIEKFETKLKRDKKQPDLSILFSFFNAFDCNVLRLKETVDFYRTGLTYSFDSFNFLFSNPPQFFGTVHKFIFVQSENFFDFDPSNIEVLEY